MNATKDQALRVCKITGLLVHPIGLMDGVDAVHPQSHWAMKVGKLEIVNRIRGYNPDFTIEGFEFLRSVELSLRILTLGWVCANQLAAEPWAAEPVEALPPSEAKLKMELMCLKRLAAYNSSELLECPLIRNFNSNVASTIYFIVDGGMDARLSGQLRDLWVYVNDISALASRYGDRLKPLVTSLIEAGLSEDASLFTARYWVLEGLQAEASDAEELFMVTQELNSHVKSGTESGIIGTVITFESLGGCKHKAINRKLAAKVLAHVAKCLRDLTPHNFKPVAEKEVQSSAQRVTTLTPAPLLNSPKLKSKLGAKQDVKGQIN